MLDEEPGGARPDRLFEVRPQERVQRHTVEQIILAPMLDVPVPLMEEQLLVDAFAPHDIQVPEQVIEVPKILIDELSVRTPVREPQLAEQLWWKYRRSSPFPRCSGLWSRTWIFRFRVVVCKVFKVFPQDRLQQRHLSLERISERNVEQIVDIPGKRPSRFPSRTWFNGIVHFFARSSWCRGRAVSMGFLALFHRRTKRCEELVRTRGSELSADFISSTPSAYEKAHFSDDGNFFFEEDQKTWMRLPSGWWYLLCSEPGEYRVDPRVSG